MEQRYLDIFYVLECVSVCACVCELTKRQVRVIALSGRAKGKVK